MTVAQTMLNVCLALAPHASAQAAFIEIFDSVQGRRVEDIVLCLIKPLEEGLSKGRWPERF